MPETCFKLTHRLLDADGNDPAAYANLLAARPRVASADSNQFVIDQAGNREFAWISNPITLHWTLDVSDGTTVYDVQVVTVTGVSACSAAVFTPEIIPLQAFEVGQVPTTWIKT